MNWLTLTVLGAVAAWFEYSYQRSRRKKKSGALTSDSPVPESARVAQPGEMPSIPPGAENDKKLNTVV
jgi:hypothetical protein